MPRPRAKMDKEELQELVNTGVKNYVKYDEGARLYSMGRNSFIKLAKEARAIYKVKGIALVNIQKVNHYIEEYLVEF